MHAGATVVGVDLFVRSASPGQAAVSGILCGCVCDCSVIQSCHCLQLMAELTLCKSNTIKIGSSNTSLLLPRVPVSVMSKPHELYTTCRLIILIYAGNELCKGKL